MAGPGEGSPNAASLRLRSLGAPLSATSLQRVSPLIHPLSPRNGPPSHQVGPWRRFVDKKEAPFRLQREKREAFRAALLADKRALWAERDAALCSEAASLEAEGGVLAAAGEGRVQVAGVLHRAVAALQLLEEEGAPSPPGLESAPRSTEELA